MADIEIPIETCAYCGEERHIRQMKIDADTFDELSGTTAIREVGKYRICEDCLEFLGRMLECNVNLRDHVKKVSEAKPIPAPAPVVPEVAPTDSETVSETEKPVVSVGAIYPGYRQFAIAKNAEQLQNFIGWDLLKIIKNAERFTEYGFPQKIVQRVVNQFNPNDAAADSQWVELDDRRDDTQRVFPIKRKVTHYLMGLPYDKAMNDLVATVNLFRTREKNMSDRLFTAESQRDALNEKTKQISKSMDAIMKQNAELIESRDGMSCEITDLNEKIDKLIEQKQEYERRLVDAGMIRDIDLGDLQ